MPWPVIRASLLFALTTASVQAAGITTFSNRATFMNAVGPATVEDFTDSSHFPIYSGVLNEFTTEAGLSVGDIQPGVTYSTPGGQWAVAIDRGGGYEGGFLDSLTRDGEKLLTITFDSAMGSFGFDTNRLMGQAFDITINFLSGPSYSQTFNVDQSSDLRDLEFFGFASASTDIMSVIIDGNLGDTGQFNFALDDFTFSTTAVPLPAAVWLFGSALASMGIRRWLRCSGVGATGRSIA